MIKNALIFIPENDAEFPRLEELLVCATSICLIACLAKNS